MNDEERIKNIFKNLNKEMVVPHPYLKTRTLAVSRDLLSANKKIFFWKIFSGLSVAALVLTVANHQIIPQKTILSSHKPYVIHMNFTDEEVREVAVAEVTLPAELFFHSEKNPKVAELRTLRLPIKASHNGRTKLPFVVVSNGRGNQKIQVRLLDLNNSLIKQNFIKVSFNNLDRLMPTRREL